MLELLVLTLVNQGY